MNKLIDIEKEQIEEAIKAKKIPSFKSYKVVTLTQHSNQNDQTQPLNKSNFSRFVDCICNF